MNYNLWALCANFSRGELTNQALCEAFFIAYTPHAKSQKSGTITFLTVLLQPVFSCCGEWEPSGPCWQVWIIPVIFSLKHYSNIEDTYYHSQAVSTQQDPPTRYSTSVWLWGGVQSETKAENIHNPWEWAGHRYIHTHMYKTNIIHTKTGSALHG